MAECGAVTGGPQGHIDCLMTPRARSVGGHAFGAERHLGPSPDPCGPAGGGRAEQRGAACAWRPAGSQLTCADRRPPTGPPGLALQAPWTHVGRLLQAHGSGLPFQNAQVAGFCSAPRLRLRALSRVSGVGVGRSKPRPASGPASGPHPPGPQLPTTQMAASSSGSGSQRGRPPDCWLHGGKLRKARPLRPSGPDPEPGTGNPVRGFARRD